MHSPEKETVPLTTTVVAAGAVEAWLLAVETAMCSTLSSLLFRCYSEMRKTKRERWVREYSHPTFPATHTPHSPLLRWVREWAGQLTLTSGQIAWTVECTKALHAIADGQKSAMRAAKKKQVSLLTKLCDMVRGNLGKLDRKKVTAIITIEVHAREVIDKMIKNGCNSVTDFEWLLQVTSCHRHHHCHLLHHRRLHLTTPTSLLYSCASTGRRAPSAARCARRTPPTCTATSTSATRGAS